MEEDDNFHFNIDENTLRERLARPRKRGIDRLAIAEQVLNVYDALGGELSHAQWAANNPTMFYSRHYAKLLPQQSDVNVKGEFIINAPLPRNPHFDPEAPYANAEPERATLPAPPTKEGAPIPRRSRRVLAGGGDSPKP